MKGYMYILRCSNDQYYTGSTKNLELRVQQHQNGKGANFTKKYLPIKLVYFEEFQRIDEAFFREKQVQGWNRKKKEALIGGHHGILHEFSQCQNTSHSDNAPCKSDKNCDFDFDSAQSPNSAQSPDFAQSPNSAQLPDSAQSPDSARSPKIHSLNNVDKLNSSNKSIK